MEFVEHADVLVAGIFWAVGLFVYRLRELVSWFVGFV